MCVAGEEQRAGKCTGLDSVCFSSNGGFIPLLILIHCFQASTWFSCLALWLVPLWLNRFKCLWSVRGSTVSDDGNIFEKLWCLFPFSVHCIHSQWWVLSFCLCVCADPLSVELIFKDQWDDSGFDVCLHHTSNKPVLCCRTLCSDEWSRCLSGPCSWAPKAQPEPVTRRSSVFVSFLYQCIDWLCVWMSSEL